MKIIEEKAVKVGDIIQVLKNNGLVILPTETVYGAFVDASNPFAVEKLTKYKNRSFGKPYSVAVSDQIMAEKYVELNDAAKNLYNIFLPGPITVISKGKHQLANGVESENGTLGIRIPNYDLVLKVVKQLGKPITATSANASYKKRPYKITDILENISDKQKKLIDLIIDAGTLPKREPSTVIDTTLDNPIVLRQGDIKLKAKNEVVSTSPESTQNIAKELWQKYEDHKGSRAIVFALVGEMGTGKTVFTKGLAKAMGITETVTSPTYGLVQEYDSHSSKSMPSVLTVRLYHIDAWRIENSQELVDLDFAKNINDKSVIAIEWADRVADEIRKYNEDAVIIWVKINYPPVNKKGKKSENERLISWGIT